MFWSALILLLNLPFASCDILVWDNSVTTGKQLKTVKSSKSKKQQYLLIT